jgi:hypothetical protein
MAGTVLDFLLSPIDSVTRSTGRILSSCHNGEQRQSQELLFIIARCVKCHFKFLETCCKLSVYQLNVGGHIMISVAIHLFFQSVNMLWVGATTTDEVK